MNAQRASRCARRSLWADERNRIRSQSRMRAGCRDHQDEQRGTGDLHGRDLDASNNRKAGKHFSRNSGGGQSRIGIFSVSQLALSCVRGGTNADAFLEHPRRCTLIAPRACAAAAALTCLVAVTAKYWTIAAWFKWNSRWLAAAGADDRCSMGWSRTITGASPTLFALLCLTARLAALGGRVTAFLKERLIRSGERKVLSTIAARKLNISGHGSPRRDCTYELVVFI